MDVQCTRTPLLHPLVTLNLIYRSLIMNHDAPLCPFHSKIGNWPANPKEAFLSNGPTRRIVLEFRAWEKNAQVWTSQWLHCSRLDGCLATVREG